MNDHFALSFCSLKSKITCSQCGKVFDCETKKLLSIVRLHYKVHGINMTKSEIDKLIEEATLTFLGRNLYSQNYENLSEKYSDTGDAVKIGKRANVKF